MKVLKNAQFYRILVCLFYLLFFLSILLTGNFKIFVKKFYFPYIIIGVLILLFILVIESKRIKKFKETNVYDLFSFLIFLFPILIFLIVKPTSLPTYAALKRGIKTEFLSEDILKSLYEKIETEGKYKKLTVKQILALSKSKPEEINEKEVAVEGMVYKGEEKEKFILIRFLITCCAADATPLGIEVEYKEEKKEEEEFVIKEKFKNEDWIKVKGKAKIEDGKVKIYAEEVEKIQPPTDPYLY
jgi:putative membrane protein